jgi:hypothetical protein
MKITEQNEQITVFRNETGSPVGIIIAQDEYAEPLYGAFIYCVVNGWKWLVESTDKEKVYHEAREHFFCHHHFCPTCRYDIECETSYKCSAPDKDEICLDCQETKCSLCEKVIADKGEIETIEHLDNTKEVLCGECYPKREYA